MDYNAIGWIMIAVWLVSLFYPWHPGWPLAKWLLHLPFLLLALYGCYEVAMPQHMNIRLDLPLIWACMVLSAVLYLVRLILFARKPGATKNSASYGNSPR